MYKREIYFNESLITGGTKSVRFPNLNTTRLSIDDLTYGINSYVFSIRARTSIGQGEETTKRITTGPQLGRFPLLHIYR